MMNTTNPQFEGRSVEFKAAGPIAQIVSLLIVLALVVIGFIIFIPIAIGIIVLAIILYSYFKIKAALSRTHAPNGPLDGRHNVRVIDRDE